VTGSGPVVRLDDPGVVTEQYVDATRLSARQGIWAFRRPAVDFASWALSQIDLRGDETVLDVGCGNGPYLHALIERGHAGRLVGVDISAGMLAAVSPCVGRVRGDAQSVPITDAGANLTLAMHMLYHVADKAVAWRELRRVTKPHGLLHVALSDRNSLSELHQLIDGCAGRLGLAIAPHDPGMAFDEAMTLLDGSLRWSDE
jgi:SAM-dependent methyltransferase